MNFNRLLFTILFIQTTYVSGQVKVGDNSNTIDAGSILELESRNKALVITRLTDIEMNSITPLNGALVYNTDLKCVFVFEGSVWKSLCNSEISVTTSLIAPTAPEVGDIWLNVADNRDNVWDGTAWLPITKNPKTGTGAPDNTTIPDALAGDIYIDQASGDVYTYDGTTWIDHTVLEIFNRWGRRVYTVQNYDNSFQGKANVSAVVEKNTTLPPGVYFYIIDLSDIEIIHQGYLYITD